MSKTNYNVQPLPPEEMDVWRRLLSHTRPLVLFHQPEFWSIVQEVFSLHPRPLVLFKGNTPVGGMVIWERHRVGLTLAITPFYVWYNPVRILAIPTERPYREIEAFHEVSFPLLQYLERAYPIASFSTHPFLQDVRPFYWRGWQVEPQYSAILSLTPERYFVNTMDPESHRLWRRSLERTDWQFSSTDDGSSLYELIEENYARDALVPPVEKSRLTAFARFIKRAGVGDVFAVQNPAGAILAATLVVWDAHTGYGLFLGRRPGTEGNLASLRLIAETASLLQGRGQQQFDLGGAMIPHIARFKLRLGARLVPYFRCLWTRNRPIRWALNWRDEWNRWKRRRS